uniref:Coiled-coil domain-containing protein 190 isoform X1 n=2 Tax=Pogona vitticeps TaxID=103695 RepID=A0ABM5G9M4_9SAUR
MPVWTLPSICHLSLSLGEGLREHVWWVKRDMTEGETSRRWEAKRRDVKRAEARLSRGLQSLEEARFSCLNSVMKEQKRLQEELVRLQKGRSKQKLSLSPGPMSVMLPFPLLFPQAREDYSGFHGSMWKKTFSKGRGLSEASQASFRPQTLNSDISGSAGDRKGHLPPLKPKDQNMTDDRDMTTLRHSTSKQLIISAESGETEENNGTDDQGRDVGAQGSTILVNIPGKRRPSLGQEKLIMDAEAYGADGCPRNMYSRPDFLKSYSEARKARYIRHKNIPAWEKELSLQDIFGHKRTIEHSGAECD